MYLVIVPSWSFAYYVFLREDPWPACQPFLVAEGVEYDPGPPESLRWWSSGAPSELAFGRSMRDPTKFRLFRNVSVQLDESFETVEGVPWIHQTWADFLGSTHGRRLARRFGLQPGREPALNERI